MIQNGVRNATTTQNTYQENVKAVYTEEKQILSVNLSHLMGIYV